MVKVIHFKLEASTLIEVLVALLILMSVFVVSINIYSKVMISGNSSQKVIVQQNADHLLQDVYENKAVPVSNIIIDSVAYTFDVKRHEEFDGLYEVQIRALQNNRLLFSTKRVMEIVE